jgi:HK97 family phage prohead protease
MTILQTRDTTLTRLSPPLEAKFEATADKAIVVGYASTFHDQPDSYGDVVAPGAFTRTLAAHKSQGTLPAFLWSHRQDVVIGRWTEMREDGRGLHVRGEINRETTAGRDAYQHFQAGDVSGLSIGFLIAPGGSKAGPKGTTILTDLELMEVSAVALPANRNARARLESKRELEEALHKMIGLPKAAARKLAEGGWPALIGTETTTDNVKQAAERIARLAERMRTI